MLLIGKPLSMAMLNNQRVYIYIYTYYVIHHNQVSPLDRQIDRQTDRCVDKANAYIYIYKYML